MNQFIVIDESTSISDEQWEEITLTHPLFFSPIISRTKTMDEEYGDGMINHICCPYCGFCLTCGDCICNETFGGEYIERTDKQ